MVPELTGPDDPLYQADVRLCSSCRFETGDGSQSLDHWSETVSEVSERFLVGGMGARLVACCLVLA